MWRIFSTPYVLWYQLSMLLRRYRYPLTTLPQFLEILLLNLPGVLWRLSFGPQCKDDPGLP